MEVLPGIDVTFAFNASDNLYGACLVPENNEIYDGTKYGALPPGACRDFYEQFFAPDDHPEEPKKLMVELFDTYYRMANALAEADHRKYCKVFYGP